MMRALRVVAEADAEMWEGAAFYESRRDGLGTVFVDTVLSSMLEIREAPGLGSPCKSDPSFRQYVVHKFPYKIIYQVRPEVIVITAIAHTSRRPGYWLSRERS